jgi:hypothetical protein
VKTWDAEAGEYEPEVFESSSPLVTFAVTNDDIEAAD